MCRKNCRSWRSFFSSYTCLILKDNNDSWYLRKKFVRRRVPFQVFSRQSDRQKTPQKYVYKRRIKNAKNTWQQHIETIELRKTPRARWNYTAPCIPPWSPPSPSRKGIAEIDRGGSWRWWDSWWSVFSVRPWKWPICPAKFFVPSSRPFRITLPGYLASENRTIHTLL